MSKTARALFPLHFVLLFAASLASAEGTRAWEQSKFDDLSKGTAKGVAIRSTGGLELAPALKPLFATPSTYIWAIASDASGALYVASGAPARIYRVTPDGTASIIFEAKELQVQSIVAAKSGVLYAATNPDGKIINWNTSPAQRRAPTPKERPTQPFPPTRAGPRPFSSTPAPVTCGISPSTPAATSSLPPETVARY